MTMMTPLSQIDVRALELDPVVFEPLPTIHDLTPLSNQSNNNTPAGQGSMGDGSRKSQSQKNLPSVIPFASDESDLYARDWFGKQDKTYLIIFNCSYKTHIHQFIYFFQMKHIEIFLVET